MKTKNHKHKGVESGGYLKLHPASRQHKDPKVQRYHLASLKVKTKKKPKFIKKVKTEKEQPEEQAPSNVDADGYLAIDMRKLEHKGVRILGTKSGKIWFAEKGKIKGIQFDA